MELKWRQVALREFISAQRKAALYFIVPELRLAFDQLSSLQSQNVKFLFPVKSFNHPTVLQLASEKLAGFDVSNLNEYRAIESFMRPHHKIWSSSPAWNFIEGVEFNDLNSSALEGSLPWSKVALRINPDFIQIRNRFGMHEEKALKIMLEHPSVNALHVHLSGIQNVRSDFERAIEFFDRFSTEIDRPLHLNFGGGFSQLSFSELSAIVEEAKIRLPEHILYFEPGRWISRRAGLAIGTTLSIEDERVTVSLSGVCHLRWSDVNFNIALGNQGENSHEKIKYRIFGQTCYENDLIGEVLAPKGAIKFGDPIIIDHVSGYSFGWNHAFNGVDAADVIFLGH
jgi:diaminopimelate decarboxylase